MGRVAQSVTRGRIAQAHRANIAGEDLGDLFALVRVHLDQPPDSLAPVLGRIEHRTAAFELARVNPQEGQRADVRVVHDLERQRRERRVVARPALGLLAVVNLAHHRRQIERRRQILHHRVEHRLHALVAKGRAHDDRYHFDLERRRANRRLELRRLRRLALEIQLHDRIVMVRQRLDHLVAIRLGLLRQLGRNRLFAIIRTQAIVVPDQRALLDQIDYAGEFLLGADRNLQQQRLGLQLVADLVRHALELGAHAVHLVDERDARNAILVGLPPDRLRLRLDSAHRAKNRDRAVQHAQTALDFDREVDVAGRIDNIDPMVAPEAGGRGRRNRDAALLLLDHPVHRRRAFVHLANLVIDPGVIEHALGGGGLTGIDMRHDADIAHPFYWCFTSHTKKTSFTYQR